MSQTLGAIVREARVKAGRTQRQLAEEVRKEDGNSITPQYLNDIEFDRRVPSKFVINQIAKALGLKPDHLTYLAGALPQDLVDHIVQKGMSDDQVQQIRELFRKKK